MYAKESCARSTKFREARFTISKKLIRQHQKGSMKNYLNNISNKMASTLQLNFPDERMNLIRQARALLIQKIIDLTPGEESKGLYEKLSNETDEYINRMAQSLYTLENVRRRHT